MVDYEYWLLLDEWEEDDAVLLLHGIDPRSNEGEELKNLMPYLRYSTSITDEGILQVRNVYELMRNSIRAGKLGRPVFGRFSRFKDAHIEPLEFLRWAKAKARPLPPEIDAFLASKSNKPLTDSNDNKPLATSERTSLLKILYVIAVKGYGNDLLHPHQLAREIQSDAEQLDISVNDDTIAKYLKEAIEKFGLPESRIKPKS
jgi:hypothetical protein